VDFPADFDVDAFLQPFRDKYGAGKVVAIMTMAGPVAFRKPTSPEYDRVKAMAQNPADRAAASKTLCLITVVSPERNAFASMLDEYPGIADVCDDHIFALAGVDGKAAVKK
jgi:hypothetical protein